MEQERIIGTYTGEQRGPLLICLGGIHGNEPAGVHALELVFRMLEREPLANPGFRFAGRIVGLRGNLQALSMGIRYLEHDLNRMFSAEQIAFFRSSPRESLGAEALEVLELTEIIEKEIDSYQPERLVVLDLHTTSAQGGIFSVSTDDPESIRMAVELHAPVIRGMLRGIKGSTLQYFTRENTGVESVAVAFESGQHDDPLSVNRAVAAIINCLRTIGCVRPEDVENRHDQLLISYSRHLPKLAELIMVHPIKPGDDFRMADSFLNFHPVRKGDLLAYDCRGPIHAPEDGQILMPLYQTRGEDGFFLIRPLTF